ncbi:hypothetical protein CRG98_010941 [Punica granatum]|uniref:Uncharacterized protein n=1 Tax=Punica granatum TaxID=22663 RepID=A0A2I0KJJ2_PUNGR|nr:hypothetical protein CRG98_010941 [Punica granatum]
MSKDPSTSATSGRRRRRRGRPTTSSFEPTTNLSLPLSARRGQIWCHRGEISPENVSFDRWEVDPNPNLAETWSGVKLSVRFSLLLPWSLSPPSSLLSSSASTASFIDKSREAPRQRDKVFSLLAQSRLARSRAWTLGPGSRGQGKATRGAHEPCGSRSHG